MAELRRDYLLDRFVIFSTERAKRPHQFSKENSAEKDNSVDFFAPGNEDKTPPEKGHIGEPWRMRWFDNKFKAVSKDQENKHLQTHNEFYTFAQAYGEHEVIVETNDDRQLWDLSEHEIFDLLNIYSSRILDIRKQENIKYVQIFKNHGKSAGTSIRHSHSQLIALNIIPPDVATEERAVEDYIEQNETDPFDDILKYEKGSYREVFLDDIFFTFCPYASRFPFEVKILPLRDVKSITEFDQEELKNLSKNLKNILVKLKSINVDYNFFIREGVNLQRFYIDIIPRPNVWAGFEMSTGIIINPVMPEDAATFYKKG